MNEARRRDLAFSLLARIYPEAVQAVQAALDTPALQVLRLYPNRRNRGIFCLIDHSDYLIAYLAFEHDIDSCEADELRIEVVPLLPLDGSREFYFNVYGRNPQAVRLVQSMGFQPDMLGYRLSCPAPGPALPSLLPSGLAETGFVEAQLSQYSDLFDRAYYDINVANSYPLDWHTRYAEAFRVRLARMDQGGGIGSFWLDDRLVGAYLIQGLYISDLAVHPEFQNRGYGRFILSRALNRMLVEMDRPEARLNVAQTNTRAKRFYERLGFVEIGCFADHTYVPQK